MEPSRLDCKTHDHSPKAGSLANEEKRGHCQAMIAMDHWIFIIQKMTGGFASVLRHSQVVPPCQWAGLKKPKTESIWLKVKMCVFLEMTAEESRESQSTGTSTGKANSIGTSGRKIYEKSPAKETPHHPSLKLTDGKLSFDDRSSKQKADGSGTRKREIGEKNLPRSPSPNLTNGESSFNERSSRGKAAGRGTCGREIDEEPTAKVGKDPISLCDDASRMYGLNNNEYYSTQSGQVVGVLYDSWGMELGEAIAGPLTGYGS
ncbi:hypothetical protein NL676_039873 [Syzygium grande]|nr:hypothetical protein NL676_039873 [Syzygium grande]